MGDRPQDRRYRAVGSVSINLPVDSPYGCPFGYHGNGESVSLGDLGKLIQDQGKAVARAPIPYLVGLCVLAGAIWLVTHWEYGAQLASKDAEIALLTKQRDAARYDAQVATSDLDKERDRIAALEARVTALADRGDQRRLKEHERAVLIEQARMPEGAPAVTIARDGACADCAIYAQDFVAALESAGWKIGQVMFVGGPPVSPTGITISVRDTSRLPPRRRFWCGRLKRQIFTSTFYKIPTTQAPSP
jgi:hypothetical protein